MHRTSLPKGLPPDPLAPRLRPKTDFPPLPLPRPPRFPRAAGHCLAGAALAAAARIRVGERAPDARNPAGGEVLGAGGGGGGELRGVPVRVRRGGRDPTAHELQAHIPQRVSGPLDGVVSIGVPPPILHPEGSAHFLLVQFFSYRGSPPKYDQTFHNESIACEDHLSHALKDLIVIVFQGDYWKSHPHAALEMDEFWYCNTIFHMFLNGDTFFIFSLRSGQ
ncbi:hypothetical protein G2W53_037188 [Senna tora]|uniref:Uncharacterized protein n=1 Tax=Senna tora TaxID=362788 RepID=A0A834SUD0_9FABA|nr:hypothetical protein G2W53_037188 [Senna tora]